GVRLSASLPPPQGCPQLSAPVTPPEPIPNTPNWLTRKPKPNNKFRLDAKKTRTWQKSPPNRARNHVWDKWRLRFVAPPGGTVAAIRTIATLASPRRTHGDQPWIVDPGSVPSQRYRSACCSC